MGGIVGGIRVRRAALTTAAPAKRALRIPVYPMLLELIAGLAGAVGAVKAVLVQGELLFRPARAVVHVRAEEYATAMELALGLERILMVPAAASVLQVVPVRMDSASEELLYPQVRAAMPMPARLEPFVINLEIAPAV